MQPVVIYGAGGLGGVVQDILQQAGEYRPAGFLDSNPARHGQTLGDLTVFGGVDALEVVQQSGIEHIIVAVGDNIARVALAETLQARGFTLISAIHPLASISPSAQLAPHVIVGPRATVCVHARIGPHCVISAGAIAEHDTFLGHGAFLEPAVRLAGGVHVGEFARVGIGAAIIPGRKVGAGARVEPGAVVIRDVAPNMAVSGVPANPAGLFESRFVAAPTHPPVFSAPAPVGVA